MMKQSNWPRPCRTLLAGMMLLTAPAVMAQWSTHYLNGLQKVEKSQWQEAAQDFRAALAIKPAPRRDAVSEVGLIPFNYLPHYQLGRALFFLADYAGALAHFERELEYATIRELPADYNNLLRLREAATAVLQVQRSEGAPAALPWTALLEAGYRLGQGFTIRRLDSLLAAYPALDETGRQEILRWFGEHPPAARGSLARAEPAAALDTLAQARQAAQAAYLQGRYFEALARFDHLATLSPNDATLAAWRARVQFEIARLSAPAPAVAARSDTITRTEYVRAGAPVLVLREPEAATASVRTPTLRLRGYAQDDSGIAAIAFVVNGAALPEAARPLPDAAGKYHFTAEIPLRLGENEIAVTAADLDRQQHTSTERLRLRRLPPLYQTAQFWLITGVGLVFVLGTLVANRLIRNRISFVNRYNPYIAGAPIRDVEMFFGRQQLLERILRTLPNNSLMISGPRRIGKTSLQHQLLRLLKAREDPVYRFAPVLVDLQGVAEESFFAHLIEEARDQLGPAVAAAVAKPQPRTGYGHREFAEDLRTILACLQAGEHDRGAAGRRVRLVFLLDEVDELNRYSERTNQRLRSIFMKSFSENLVAVLTGSNIRKQWESESSPWYNFFEQIAMPALSRAEALQLIHEPVRGFFKFTPEAAERIWQLSEGRPFLIQKFCVRLVNHAIETRRRVIRLPEVERLRHEVREETAS